MTPASCRIEGILELEKGKLRFTLIKAILKATLRAGAVLREINRLEKWLRALVCLEPD